MSNDVIAKSLLSLIVFNCKTQDNPIILARTEDLSQFSFWTRSTIREFITFASRQVASRTQKGERTCIKHSPNDMDMEFHTHTFVNGEGLGCVVLTGGLYSQRVAFTLVSKALEETKKNLGEKAFAYNSDQNLTVNTVQENFTKFTKPEEADSIMKIERDLNDTKEILVQSVEKLLVRGERLEELMEKSNDLSFQSKAFAKQAKSLNSCCTIL
eukprot:TRINITY_DN356_c0_g1_i1.p1 TRINITY_DN356_c0_g1~~TRINITY_DN356_c0_g1_i1.p1  ORF type:complete len:213 (-),score=48.83 TRINITY_DN356_c0_g1_i1:110-748(-)